jgi:hypothetical protein
MKIVNCECAVTENKDWTQTEIESIGSYLGWCKNCKRPIEEEKAKSLYSISEERLRLPKSVASLIPDSETVKFSIRASFKGKPKDKSGYAVITNKNIYLIGSVTKVFGKADPMTKETIQFSQITGLEQTLENYLTIKTHHIKITRANNNDAIYGLSYESALAFIDVANSQMQNQGGGNAVVQSDPIEQLTKLASLLEKGLVTQEEFDKKKKELLGL